MAAVDAREIAAPYLEEVRREVATLPPIRLVGILAADARASRTYSSYAEKGCAEVGIAYELRRVDPEHVSRALFDASEDPGVHGILVFYPVFGGARDRSLQNELEPTKDVEGLHASWTRRLYNDVRHVDEAETKKAILPCTPLGIVKALRHMGVTRADVPPRESAAGLTVTIFNRSEVVGRPLAAMLAHDGATVYSFDLDGVVRYEGTETFPAREDRAAALAESSVVITGVPSPDFPSIRAAELGEGVTCVNFSHFNNLAPDVEAKAKQVLTRVGPITVAMLLRNTVRLYRNFHARPREGADPAASAPAPERG